MAMASNSTVSCSVVPSTRRATSAAPAATCSPHRLSRRQHVVNVLSQTHSPVISPGRLSHSVSISETFANLRKQGKVAFIPYITAGDPDLSTTSEALRALDACGSSIIELGVPHSNPLADGPVIQAACARALAKGTNFDAIVSMLNEVIPQISCPITLFSYYNPTIKYGVSKFLKAMNGAGIRGLIVPDLPFEEIKNFSKEAKENKIELVLLTTPTIEKEQMKVIVETSEGFLYLASHSGATGALSSINSELHVVLQEIRKVTNKPISIGFGISKPEHVKQLSAWGADGVIVGSALVKLLGDARSPKEGLREMQAYARSLMSVLP